MFPYARRQLVDYCQSHWGESSLVQAIELLAQDAGFQSSDAWFASHAELTPQKIVTDFAAQLMDSDSKATGLKSLQGLLWRSGFETGQLRSHLFDDVLPALVQWQSMGIASAIYSSGSVTAQRLFFGHSIAGDLNPYFVANFDTTIGNKRETDSYRRIAEQLACDPPAILFLSDIAAELDAAKLAGMQTVAVVRPGNAPLPEDYVGERIESFEEL